MTTWTNVERLPSRDAVLLSTARRNRVTQVASPYADGRFVFTILDDTDDATVENLEPIYRLLTELGMRTTKTVWPLDCPPELQGPFFAAQTLQDPEYLTFVKRLVDAGFELAFHGATMGSSSREQTVRGIEFLTSEFGQVPKIHCNHGQNRENLYWGLKRYRSILGMLLRGPVALSRKKAPFEGEDPGSPFFWGDQCQVHFRFVRGFTFKQLDILKIPPGRPYHDRSTPWVNYWFTTSDAPDVKAFKALVTPAAIDRLVSSGGVCIMSTHLGKGFAHDGKVDPTVGSMLTYIARLCGHFRPVSEILERLLPEPSNQVLPRWTRLRLESMHILHRVVGRTLRTQSEP